MNLRFQPSFDRRGNVYREFIPRTYLDSMSLGDVNNLQIASIAATGATTTVGILGTLGIVSGPIGAAVAALIAVGMGIAQFFKGCGQTCVVASQDANKVEPLLLQNLNAYLSAPVRYRSMQSAALNNFDTIWAALVKACSDPALQAAGQRCISDRQAGACTWKASPGGWSQGADGTWIYTPYGAAGSGNACWNWFVGYRDPIANDPDVQPDPANAITGAGTATGTGTPSTGLNIPLPLILGAGLIFLAATR